MLQNVTQLCSFSHSASLEILHCPGLQLGYLRFSLWRQWKPRISLLANNTLWKYVEQRWFLLKVNVTGQQQITGIQFYSCKGWRFLPTQLIYEDQWRFGATHVEKSLTMALMLYCILAHWSNEDKVVKLLQEVVFPSLYVKNTRENLDYLRNKKQMWSLIRLSGWQQLCQCACAIYVSRIFQPLDLVINNIAKQFLKNLKFEEWYAVQVESQISYGRAKMYRRRKLTQRCP